MQLALVNKETSLVDNVIVPPVGANAYFVPAEYDGVPCEDSVGIGWTYNKETKEFTAPPVPDPVEEQEPSEE